MRFFLYSLIIYSAAIGTSYTISGSDIAKAALKRTEHSVIYDPTYYKIDYPNGDVPSSSGVCTDVVIRAYRALGIDLQKLVHKDMKTNFSKYPKLWGASHTDTNIDHRRVPNLQTFFKRHGASLTVTKNPKDYRPGDIVTWNLRDKGSLPHIGIVINKVSRDGTPLIVHNIGSGPQCENMLFSYKITGHYKYHPNDL